LVLENGHETARLPTLKYDTFVPTAMQNLPAQGQESELGSRSRTEGPRLTQTIDEYVDHESPIST